MKRDLGKGKRRTICLTVMTIVATLLTACGSKISVVEAGKAYTINEMCNVLDTYDQYSIQVPVEQMSEELVEDGFQTLTFKSHNVAAADDTTSEGGKYDAVDTVVVSVEGVNAFEILPQTFEMAVEYKRDVETLQWTATSKSCRNWKINHKKLGGTCWKMSTAEGDTYIRLRDTIEFFYTKVNDSEGGTMQADFDTTILGAMATVKDRVTELERIHISAGSVTPTGIITLKMEIDFEEEREVVLSEFELIDKAELPFSEEEFNAVAVR